MTAPPPLPPRPLGDLVALLRDADPAFRVFGSCVHRYRVEDALSEDELADFERTHGIRLPEEYRAYLRDVGNGGAGPYYGLLPLEPFGGPLDAPFPFTETTEDVDGEPLDPDALPGLVALADKGCAMTSCLVVSGPASGTVWGYAEGIYPEAASFDAWFRTWAEQKLRLLAREPLVGRLRVGMTLAEAEAVAGTPWRVRWDEPPLAFREGETPYRLAATDDLWATVKVDDAGTILSIRPAPFL